MWLERPDNSLGCTPIGLPIWSLKCTRFASEHGRTQKSSGQLATSFSCAHGPPSFVTASAFPDRSSMTLDAKFSILGAKQTRFFLAYHAGSMSFAPKTIAPRHLRPDIWAHDICAHRHLRPQTFAPTTVEHKTIAPTDIWAHRHLRPFDPRVLRWRIVLWPTHDEPASDHLRPSFLNAAYF